MTELLARCRRLITELDADIGHETLKEAFAQACAEIDTLRTRLDDAEERLRNFPLGATPAPEPHCNTIPIDPTREAACTEPYHWDDGVPYCDTCGLYRDSVARKLGRPGP